MSVAVFDIFKNYFVELFGTFSLTERGNIFIEYLSVIFSVLIICITLRFIFKLFNAFFRW